MTFSLDEMRQRARDAVRDGICERCGANPGREYHTLKAGATRTEPKMIFVCYSCHCSIHDVVEGVGPLECI